MVYTAVAGKGGRTLCGELYAALGKLCEVVRADETLLAASGDGPPEVLLWHCPEDARLRVRGGVLVLSAEGGGLERLQVRQDCVVVADAADEAAAGFAASRGLRLLDCGLSSKASLTFSSIGRGTGVISLQRGIQDLYGNKLEPFDLPLNIEPSPHYPVLAAVGVLLLSGKVSCLEPVKYGMTTCKNLL